MSKKRGRARSKGVVLKKRTAPIAQSVAQPTSAAMGDVYLSVVAAFGFDPIKEARERRHKPS